MMDLDAISGLAPKPKTFEVFGNYGSMTVSKETGEVLAYNTEDSDFDDTKPGEGYADILCFDLSSFDGPFSVEEFDHVDVLDLGFWTKNGEYVERARDWEADE